MPKTAFSFDSHLVWFLVGGCFSAILAAGTAGVWVCVVVGSEFRLVGVRMERVGDGW